MSLRSFNPCFGASRRTGAIAVSGFLLVFSSIFMVLCFSQLSAGSTMLPNGTQAAFAIASMLQVVLVALTSTIIFASWKESAQLICFSAYLSPIHFVLNFIVLVCLLAAVASTVPCTTGHRLPCPRLVAAKPAWDFLSVLILAAQLYLSLVVFSYFFYLQDHSRRPYMPEGNPRGLSAPPSHKPDRKGLLSNSGPYHNIELSAVESATTARSFLIPDQGTGYGGGMRTYEEAEENEKARLHRLEMESDGDQGVTFPIPSTSLLTPLGLEWRDGDLPPYAS